MPAPSSLTLTLDPDLAARLAAAAETPASHPPTSPSGPFATTSTA